MMEIDIEIDGLTNCLVKRATGEECDTQYRLISKQLQKLMPQSWKKKVGFLIGVYLIQMDMKYMSFC